MTEDQKKNLPKEEKKPELTELELAQKKAEEYLAGWQRAKADYINFKKETEQRQGEFLAYANIATVLEILPVYDNLQAAFKHLPKDLVGHEWIRGLENIKKQFESILKTFSLEPIKTVGEKFNPEFHESVAHETKEGIKPEIIFEEVAPGYKMNGKVLRAAKVKVAK